MPVAESEVIQTVVIGCVGTNEVVIIWQPHDVEAAVGQADTDSCVRHPRADASRSMRSDRPSTGVAAADKERSYNWEIRNGNRFECPQEPNAQMRLLAQPRIPIPHAARNKRIVITRNNEDRTGIGGAF